MQEVSWHASLGELAQHDDFHNAVKDIVDFSKHFIGFHLSAQDQGSLSYNGANDLLTRARLMNARFRFTGFGSTPVILDLSSKEPVSYRSRGRARKSDRS